MISSNGVNGAASSETTAGYGIQGDFGLSLTQDGYLPAAFLVGASSHTSHPPGLSCKRLISFYSAQVGLLVSSPIFAEASKHVNAFRLIALGLAVWTLATAGCGLAIGQWLSNHLACPQYTRPQPMLHVNTALPCNNRPYGSCPLHRKACSIQQRSCERRHAGFWSLIICRMLVGVGEASFVALASPFIGAAPVCICMLPNQRPRTPGSGHLAEHGFHVEGAS